MVLLNRTKQFIEYSIIFFGKRYLVVISYTQITFHSLSSFCMPYHDTGNIRTIIQGFLSVMILSAAICKRADTVNRAQSIWNWLAPLSILYILIRNLWVLALSRVLQSCFTIKYRNKLSLKHLNVQKNSPFTTHICNIDYLQCYFTCFSN